MTQFRSLHSVNGASTGDICSAAVVGAGAMGAGITTAFAIAGVPVTLLDVSQTAVDRGLSIVKANLEGAASRGKITPEDAERAIGSIAGAVDYEALANTDLVVEAVFEDLSLKKDVFAALDRATKPEAILATNTSYLDIDAIAAVTGRPDRVVGLHFFNPAHIMKLLEIVRAAKTSDEVLASGVALAARLGKTAVIARNAFGFIGNRMLNAYRTEALDLALEGAPIATIDRALAEFGMPMGPFALMDLTGLEVNVKMRQQADPRYIDRQAFEIVDRLYADGRTGQKSGAGFYRYEPGARSPKPDEAVDAIIADIAGSHRLQRRASIPGGEILDRCLLMLVNEGARILEERVASTARDIDTTYVAGYGFPKEKGGPMVWAEARGLAEVLDAIRRNFKATGKARWLPARLLEDAASEGRLFDAALTVRHGSAG
ncbi:MAG: 3-hydroxyacyl-CoA dehydrogenase NAD-binding domain-containing protein [Parvularculaceae bacterium]|nr:3-hydroxyacyl-CoA dehydrogenase NAD-binding domain-containing protein [Parvularculaceae bacterium]